MVRATGITVAALAALSAQPAFAMPLAAKERLDQLARWVPYTAACSSVGYVYRQDMKSAAVGPAIDEAIVGAAVSLGADEAEARLEYQEALTRNNELFRIEMAAAVPRPGFAGPFRPPLARLFQSFDQQCLRLSADPIFAPYIQPMPAAERVAARVATEDAILAPNGEASWQGPKSQVRGDLFFMAGLCRRFLNLDQLDRYRVRMNAEGERARVYYEGLYTSGIDRAAEFAFDQAQCSKGLAGLDAKAK